MAWAVAVVQFRTAGKVIDPVSLNLFKNTVGLVLIGVTLVLVGGWGQTAGVDVAVLLASGTVGIALADTLFLYALNQIGAARVGVISAGYPVSVILLSFAFLGESFVPIQWLGALAVVGAIVLAAVSEPPVESETSESGSPTNPTRGLVAGLVSVFCMAVGVVMAKPALACTDVVTASALRLAGGNLALALYCLTRPDRARIFGVLRPGPHWRLALPPSIVGTYLAYMLWIGGMKYADVSVAAVLNQLSVVYIALLAWFFLGERLTRLKLVAVGLGLMGSVVVALGTEPNDDEPECAGSTDADS